MGPCDRTDAPSPEVVLAPDQDVMDIPNWGQTPGQAWDSWVDFISYLDWKFLGITLEEFENLAGKRDSWDNSHSSLPPKPTAHGNIKVWIKVWKVAKLASWVF